MTAADNRAVHSFIFWLALFFSAAWSARRRVDSPSFFWTKPLSSLSAIGVFHSVSVLPRAWSGRACPFFFSHDGRDFCRAAPTTPSGLPARATVPSCVTVTTCGVFLLFSPRKNDGSLGAQVGFLGFPCGGSIRDDWPSGGRCWPPLRPDELGFPLTGIRSAVPLLPPSGPPALDVGSAIFSGGGMARSYCAVRRAARLLYGPAFGSRFFFLFDGWGEFSPS